MRNRKSARLIQSRIAIAGTSPVPAVGGFPLDKLDDFLANGPQLGADRKSMAKDVREVRAKLWSRATPWFD
jgi:hypothetical protein